MSNQNFIPLLLSSFIASFVVYKCCARKKDIVENYWTSSVPMTTTTELIGPDGNSIPAGTQKNLTYDTNPLYNPLFTEKSVIQDGLKTSLEGYEHESDHSKTPFHTVNGYKQSYLPPRFDNNGTASTVRYNLPEEQHLGSKPSDPFTIAEYFEAPGSEKKPEPKMKSDVAPVDLPVDLTMKNSGAPKQQNQDFIVNSERLLFHTAKSHLQGLGCSIRGDLPVIGIAPSSDVNSLISFRPAAGATPQSSLRTGALSVIAGTGGNTAYESLANLQASASGGVSTAKYSNGVPMLPPEGSIGMKALQSPSGTISGTSDIQSLASSKKGAPNTITNYNSVIPV